MNVEWMIKDYNEMFENNIPNCVMQLIKEYEEKNLTHYTGMGTKYSSYEKYKGTIKNKSYYESLDLYKKIEKLACEMYTKNN